jgi:hypothetical protein
MVEQSLDRQAVRLVRKRPWLRTVSDRPIFDAAADYLGFGAYAEALAELIDDPKTATPLTVAISAPWGSGKTSLARLLELRLSERARERHTRPPLVVWFNAWRHADAPHLGAAFAADVARTVAQKRRLWRRLWSPLPSAMLGPHERWRRRVAMGILLLAGALAFVLLVRGITHIVTGVGFQSSARHALPQALASALVFGAAAIAVAGKARGFAAAAARFVGNPRAEALRGSMDLVADELGTILEQGSRGRRIVIFIDDLERCTGQRAVEVCEVASQLLAHPDVVTVFLADMEVIASSAAEKYAKLEGLAAPGGAAEYGRVYLQKLIQIEFALPPPNADHLRELLISEGVAHVTSSSEAIDDDEHGLEETTPAGISVGPQVMMTLSAALAAAGAMFAAGGGSKIRIGGVEVGSSLPRFMYISLIATTAAYLARAAWDTSRDAKVSAAEDELRRIIKRIAGEVKDDPDRLEKNVLATSEAQKRPGLAKQLLRRHEVDDSELRHQAQEEILAFIPLNPRSAKRMLNRLRVLLVVASHRQMFGGAPPLDARHLGKWVVLNERWPELARATVTNPDLLRTLESSRSARRLARRLDALELRTRASPELFAFLKRNPRLGDIVARLAHFTPAALEQGS